MTFQYEKNRVFAKDLSGKLVAEITFPLEGGLYNINHTFVDDSLRGQGVAGRLMREAIGQIKEQGGRAAATCSYAKAWFEKHPEETAILGN